MENSSENNKPVSPDPQQALLASRDFACQVARLAADRHCTDIVIMELADRSPVAMHFVVATGTSDVQIRSVARELEQLGKKCGFSVYGHAGIQQGRWAIVDFVDIVVHLFDSEFRVFYDLELLWGDAPRIDWSKH